MSKVLSVSIVLLLLATAASADWDPGDGHKMHYPQLPDINGWDVTATATSPAGGGAIVRHVADDWKGSETGPVLDLHFWGSWKNGIKGTVESFMIEIWADDPVGPGGYFPDNEYSTPLYRFTDEHYDPDDPMNGEPGRYWYYGAYTHEGWDMPDYIELRDPQDQAISLDMAFVITPEPATLGLLLLGGLALLRRRR